MFILCLYSGRNISSNINTLYALQVTDLNNPPKAFILNTAANPIGMPNLGANGCLVIQHNLGYGVFTAQLAFSFGSDKIAIRRKHTSNAWTDWKYIIIN